VRMYLGVCANVCVCVCVCQSCCSDFNSALFVVVRCCVGIAPHAGRIGSAG